MAGRDIAGTVENHQGIHALENENYRADRINRNGKNDRCKYAAVAEDSGF